MKRFFIVMAIVGIFTTLCFGQTPFAVLSSGNLQQSPSVSNGIIVWQEYVNYNGQQDWDIYGVDVINAPAQLLSIAAFDADQTQPSIWKTWVAWQDNYYTDLDIWVSDISNVANITTHAIATYTNDQSYPKVHGNTVVWQNQIADPDTQVLDWDIYAADITEPNTPLVYPVAAFTGDQQRPDIYRSFITWHDNFWGDNDIMAADALLRNNPQQYIVSSLTTQQTNPVTDSKYVIWQEEYAADDVDLYGADVSDPANPVEFLITAAPGLQINPALSGHLVVWQDNRNGNWDIYGYNLITRQEFQITNDTYNQTAPAIDGLLTAYEDDRSGTKEIYALWLEGVNTAYCSTRILGDANNDCRIDLTDLTDVAANWLSNKLTY